MASQVTRPYLGLIMMKKKAGSGAVSVGTQVNIPSARANPFNPVNNDYPSVINASSFPSLVVPGKKTPGASIQTYWKNSFCNADLINSLIFTLDADNNTDCWNLGFKDDRSSVRSWDWSRCEQITLTQMAMGGPIIVELDFLSRWGETEMPNATALADGETTPATTTYTTTAVIDYGTLSDVSFVSFGGTFTHVRAWTLSLYRVQAHVGFVDQTLYAKDICSGPFTGTFSIEQSPMSSSYISGASSGSLNLRIGTTAAVSAYTQFALKLKLDREVLPHDSAFGNITRTYSLMDTGSGGNPATCTQV